MRMTQNKLGDLIHAARKKLRMTQTDLADALGRSRQWIGQLERGQWYYSQETFTASPDELVKIAGILDISPVEVLIAAGVDKSKWPDLSHIRSKDVNVRTIDLTSLTTNQIRLVEDLVEEFRTGRHNDQGKRR